MARCGLPCQAAYTATELGAPLLGRIPLDPEISHHCDVGRIEAYETEAFEPIVEQVVQRLEARKKISEDNGA